MLKDPKRLLARANKFSSLNTLAAQSAFAKRWVVPQVFLPVQRHIATARYEASSFSLVGPQLPDASAEPLARQDGPAQRQLAHPLGRTAYAS